MSDFAGDLDVSTTWKRLAEQPTSILVDVRTAAEWAFVGVPDLASLDKSVVLQEWQQYPHMTINPNFVTNVAQAIKQQGGDESSEIYFLCRSGVRSMAAAIELTKMGFSKCFNVSGGFEGPPNAERHRGLVDGWKASDLPWVQN